VYTSDYPVFYVTVDVVCLTVRDGVFSVLLVERGDGVEGGRWALPGGFVHPDEDLEQAARRELVEETAVHAPALLEQLATYGDPDRDPRGRVVSVAHLAIAPGLGEAAGGSDAAAAAWVPVEEALGRDLAFDHATILRDGIARARAKLEWSVVATSFCAPEFTIADLRGVYEAVWGRRLDPANFHRKVTGAQDFVVPLGRTADRGPGRPAQLFRAGAATRIHPPLGLGQA
jgi:8-oxo-dGTP diphosphatase